MFDELFESIFGSALPKKTEKPTKANGREEYQEALITELLRSLVANSILTKDEAQAVIRRAKEATK